MESAQWAYRMLVATHRRISPESPRSNGHAQHNLFTFFSWVIRAFAREVKDADLLELERDVYQEAYDKMTTGVEEWKSRASRLDEECAEARRALSESEQLVKAMRAESEELLRTVQAERDFWRERTRLYEELFGAAAQRMR